MICGPDDRQRSGHKQRAESFVAASGGYLTRGSNERNNIPRGDRKHFGGSDRGDRGKDFGRRQPTNRLPYRHNVQEMRNAATDDEQAKRPEESLIGKRFS